MAKFHVNEHKKFTYMDRYNILLQKKNKGYFNKKINK